ncbi:MAG TPA: hypothetical protein VGG97_13755 [Bryobacteraceae bacterium]|jgi:hypothetical protein
MKRYLVFFACCVLLPAQVGAPNVGSARFAGHVFAVRGIPANFLVAKTPWTSAAAVSFSDAGGLLSQSGTVTLTGPDGASLADYASGEAAPILNIDGPLATAVAWLPAKHALLHWNGKAFILQEVNDSAFAGEVTYVQLNSPRMAKLLVTHGDATVSAVTVSVETGEVLSADLLPSAHGHAFVQCSFVLSEEKQGLVVESVSGERRTITLAQNPLPEGDLSIERMSTDWLHISSASTGQHWALFLNSKDLSLSALPVPPGESKTEAAQ